METILVTGGAGFIGSNIADALVSRGFQVVVLDDMSSGRLENIDHLLHHRNFTFIRGSILDSGLLRSVMKTYRISGISHQAAIASVNKSVLSPVKTLETNITGTGNLFDIAAENDCRRVVFASSCAIYGDGPESPKCEHMRPDPKSPYAVSKAAKEMLARAFCNLHSTEIIALRYFNVYGKRQHAMSDYAAVIPAFMTQALENQPLYIDGDGLQTRDFVYIDDVVQANLFGLTLKKAPAGCFNIGSGSSVGILELARLIIKLAGSGSSVMHRPPRPGDVRDSAADIASARSGLGYSPAFTIEQGLRETLEWFKRKEARPLTLENAANRTPEAEVSAETGGKQAA
jgi:nucleoside-diphosphate-sugar epimerase